MGLPMRVGGYLFMSAVLAAACTQILGIDGRYVREGAEAETGGGFGSGGSDAATAGTGGSHASGGGTGSGGVIVGSGGIVAMGGVQTAGGAGGVVESGGTSGAETGGVMGSGGAPDSGATCESGKKWCPSLGCVTPDPSVGCGPGLNCTPCTAQNNAQLICTGDQCDYTCYQGFKKNSSTGACEAASSGTGGGGGGGAGGAGNIGARCSQVSPGPSSECKPCGPFPGCCNLTLHCGCLYVAACV